MKPVAASSTSAARPRICSCVVTGFEPMKGMRKVASVARGCAGFAGLRAAALAAGFTEPGRVAGPPTAGMLVTVEAGPADGRATGFGFGAPRRRNQSPMEDLGLTACAFAIAFSYAPTSRNRGSRASAGRSSSSQRLPPASVYTAPTQGWASAGRVADFDLGPLSWVKTEIDHSLYQ